MVAFILADEGVIRSARVPSQVGDDKEGAALEGEIYLALAKATQGNGGKVLCSLTDHLMEPMNVTWKYTGTVRRRRCRMALPCKCMQ